MILRHGDKTILAAHQEFWGKVWWNRHQNWLHQEEGGANRTQVREEESWLGRLVNMPEVRRPIRSRIHMHTMRPTKAETATQIIKLQDDECSGYSAVTE